MWTCRYIMSYIRSGPQLWTQNSLKFHKCAPRSLQVDLHSVFTAPVFWLSPIKWWQRWNCRLVMSCEYRESFRLRSVFWHLDYSVHFPDEMMHPIKPRGCSLCWLLFLFLLAGQFVFSVLVLRIYQKGINDLLCYYSYLRGHFKVAAFFWQWACLDR